jgi:predicted homoserine dehydrogenase-like protein
MNLHAKLLARQAEGRPLRVGVIGCGKFAGMFLAQAACTPGLHVVAIADLAPERARESLAKIGWRSDPLGARTARAARRDGGTRLTDDAIAVTGCPEIELVVEATGVVTSPPYSPRPARRCRACS